MGRSALALLALVSLARGQGLPDPLLPSNPAPLGYCPAERRAAGATAPQQVLNVFLPLGSPPARGWPVVLVTGYGGGAAVPPLGQLSSTGPSAALRNLVAAGIAVVHFGATGLGANNRGLWYPPGHPSGRYESFRPAHDNPEKCAQWALQWLKVQSAYPFDLERVALRGSSGGAVLAMRTAMGPDLARASGSAQLRASTRVAAIVAFQPPTSIWALEQGPELTLPTPRHLEQAALPFVAATQFSQVDPELQKDYSLMRSCFQTTEARANNAGQALCLVFGDPVLHIGSAVAPFDLDASGFPLLTDAIKQPLQHDSWFGYVFYKSLRGISPQAAAFHDANSLFAVRDIYALPPPLALHSATYPGMITGPAATLLAHNWLVGRLVRPSVPMLLSARPLPISLALSAGGDAGGLVLEEGELRAGATLVLRLRPPAHLAGTECLPLLALSGGLSPSGMETPWGELGLAPRFARFLIGAPVPAGAGGASFRIRLPDDPAGLASGLRAQGLFLAARAGAIQRLCLTNALLLSSGEREHAGSLPPVSVPR